MFLLFCALKDYYQEICVITPNYVEFIHFDLNFFFFKSKVNIFVPAKHARFIHKNLEYIKLRRRMYLMQMLDPGMALKQRIGGLIFGRANINKLLSRVMIIIKLLKNVCFQTLCTII